MDYQSNVTNERRDNGSPPWGLSVRITAVGSVIGIVFASFIGARLGPVFINAPENILRHADVIASMIMGSIFGAFIGNAEGRVLKQYISQTGLWMIASIFGWGFGLSIVMVLTRYFLFPDSPVFLVTLFGVMGGGISRIMQSYFLRNRISRGGWWVVASSVGWAIGFSILGIALIKENYWVALFGGAIGGAITGAALVWLLQQNDPIPGSNTLKGEG